MPPSKADYVRTDELDRTIVPLDTIRNYFGVSRDTIERWARADGIQVHDLPSPNGPGREKGMVWTDIRSLPAHKTRWQRRN